MSNDPIQAEIDRLKEKQKERRTTFQKAEAARILAWLVGLVGEAPEQVSVATLERLMLEAPCDIYVNGLDRNRWEKNKPRDNVVCFCVMVPDGDQGWQGVQGQGSTIVEALRRAIDRLQSPDLFAWPRS